MLPKLKVSYKIESQLSKLHIRNPVNPGFLILFVNLPHCSVKRVYSIKNQIALISIHPLYHNSCTIIAPVWSSKILICLRIKICPHNIPSLNCDKTKLCLGVWISRFRIPCSHHCSVFSCSIIDGKHRYICIVKTIKCNSPAIG